MIDKDKMYFRGLLEKELSDISESKNITTERLTDSLDLASETMSNAMQEALNNRNETKRHNILKAISRLENNDFGICEECGEDIARTRLKVQPTTTLCINCQEDFEKGR